MTMPELEPRDHSAGDSDLGEVLATQKRYYDLRAPDYLDSAKPSDRGGRNHPFPSELAAPIFEDLRPFGDVLELACGPGPLFTSELARYADSVTAVDASPTMLQLNHGHVADPKVTYIEADLFEWSPDRTYDFVFFGHCCRTSRQHGSLTSGTWCAPARAIADVSGSSTRTSGRHGWTRTGPPSTVR